MSAHVRRASANGRPLMPYKLKPSIGRDGVSSAAVTECRTPRAVTAEAATRRVNSRRDIRGDTVAVLPSSLVIVHFLLLLDLECCGSTQPSIQCRRTRLMAIG